MEAAFWAHQRHTSTEYTLHNTAVAQAFIIPESSFIPYSRQCTSTRPFTPHLPHPLLDRILRIRALVNHAADDLTAALDHIEAIGRFSPRQLKGKGTGKPTDTSEPTDDATTGIPQGELIHPYTPPQTMALPTPHHLLSPPTLHHKHSHRQSPLRQQ